MKQIISLMALTLLFFFAYEASAQNFTNNTNGVYTACATGKIVMRNNTGIFNGTAELGLTNTANPNGRIQGIVDWASNAGTQNVQNRYYTDLTVSAGSQKDFTDAYISGVYTNSGSTGARNYGTGTIHYDGAAQNITQENGASAANGRYYNLVFEGTGDKTIVNATTVIADNMLTTNGAAVGTIVAGTFEIGKIPAATASTVAGPFTVSGAGGAFKNGNSDIALNGAVSLTGGGATGAVFTIDGTGDATINAAATVTDGNLNLVSADGTANLIVANTGSLTLGNSADANIDLGAGSRMIVTGTYANSFCAGTNVNYNVTSTVHYNGAAGQAVATTVNTNPYGNLWTDVGDKILSACAFPAGVYIAGNLAVNGGNLYLGNAANVGASTSTLYMTNLTKSVIYNDAAHTASADGGAEVVGAMRLMASGASQFANSTYRFNNHGMQVTFASVSNAATNYFEVLSYPATNPRQYDGTRDLNRRISLRYDNAMTFNASVQAGYKVSDIPGTWNAGYSENEFRFWESNTTGLEKIATGNPYVRTAAGTIHTVSLAGITETATDIDGVMPALGNADAGFFATNDLILRAGPTIFYSIRDGRWSNPATWDEGAQPGDNDDAVIRHTVHAGYTRASDNYAQPELHPLTLVKNVTINDLAGASLLWGGGVAPGDVSVFYFTAGGTVANSLTNNRVAGIMAPSGGNDVTNTPFNGLTIFNTSTVRTNNLINNGLMNNCGTVEIGD